MAETRGKRFFAVTTWRADPPARFRLLVSEQIENILRSVLREVNPNLEKLPFRVLSSPSGRVVPRFPDRPGRAAPSDKVVIVFEFPNEENAAILQRELRKSALFEDFRLGADLPLAAAQLSPSVWCPSEAPDPAFGTRALANALLRADQLPAWAVGHSGFGPGLGVYVIVVDQGVDRDAIPASYAFGWELQPEPGDISYPVVPVVPGAARGGHGTRMAQHILSLAPEAKIVDLPLLPPHIYNVQTFTSWAAVVLLQVLADIAGWRHDAERDLPIVLCNAWAVLDSRTDATDPLFRYKDNPNHPYNLLVQFADSQKLDQVYAASNCGLFCPDNRCGPDDIGPGTAIMGANALSSVLTVGAVRTDGLRLGYSSEGPAPAAFAADKPDLCAPSQFCNDDDGATLNTGTSTACALAAGGIAAIRGVRGPGALSPSGLRTALRDTARKLGPDGQWTAGLGWDAELGRGVLDLQGVTAEI